MRPSVGRVVHYVARGSADGVFPPACRSAIITEVGAPMTPDQDAVGLAVLNPTGLFFDRGIRYDDRQTSEGTGSPGTWHFPEWVE